jgi:hypothetical protein
MILYVLLDMCFSFIWNPKSSSLIHPTKKDDAGQPLKLLHYDACRQKPEKDADGNSIRCTAKRWRFDLYDSKLTLIHYVGFHTHSPDPKHRNRVRLHVDGYVEAREKLQRGESVRSIAASLSNKYDSSFTVQCLRSIKRSLYTLNQLSGDDVVSIRSMFQSERNFLKEMSVVSSAKSEIFIVCILDEVIPAFISLGQRQVFIDGLATLSTYGCQIVTIHVKAHQRFFTLGYCIVSG